MEICLATIPLSALCELITKHIAPESLWLYRRVTKADSARSHLHPKEKKDVDIHITSAWIRWIGFNVRAE